MGYASIEACENTQRHETEVKYVREIFSCPDRLRRNSAYKLPKTALKPLHFSEKRTLGISYYGYRYYDPVTGRWLSRDPLGDKAFFTRYTRGMDTKSVRALLQESKSNAYLFSRNQPISIWDKLGLETVCSISVHYFRRWSVEEVLKHPLGPRYFPSINNHEYTGNIYGGWMDLYRDASRKQRIARYWVISGGYRHKSSRIPNGKDTVIPAGNRYRVRLDKPRGGSTRGYLVLPTPGRTYIMVHGGLVSAGCLVLPYHWKAYQGHMEDTRRAKKMQIPLSISYKFKINQ